MEALGLGGQQYIGDPMEPIDRYPQLVRHIDVGVVPLNLIPFNRAKSAIKGMEYAASGVPFVASPSDEYRWLREEYGIGRLALNADIWRAELSTLIEDAQVRVDESRKNRAAVEALDIRHRWERWADILTHVVPKARPSRAARRARR